MEMRFRTKREWWFNVDVGGIACAIIALFVIGFAWFVAVFWTIIPWLGFTNSGVANFILTNTLFILMIWSWFKGMFSDPGSVPLLSKDIIIKDEQAFKGPVLRFGEYVSFCSKCQNYKPVRSHHCSTCKRCVRLMDHHCVWFNNCVGENNQKFFLLFLLYVFLASVDVMILLILRLYRCVMTTGRGCAADQSGVTYVLSGITMFLALLFGLFVLVMGLDQFWGLWRDQSKIDKIKMQHAAKAGNAVDFTTLELPPAAVTEWGSGRWDRYAHIFGKGEQFSWLWFLPFDTNHRHDRWFADISEIDEFLQPATEKLAAEGKLFSSPPPSSYQEQTHAVESL